ncbi:hypothetical protein CHS0354_020768 [Potamilus streckersoni]|uniref:carbonic anhydrase n=1 Tax=Potamilus streckersoni TaxID=2493646 RepID=A0AAE0SCM1_9BIVA|nr:hypothetical protein CHS0354_020768 [Potamilus streckersoni]
MARVDFVATLVLCGFLNGIGGAQWGYEGDKGVDHWDTLFPDACSGLYQSPINIKTSLTEYDPNLTEFALWFNPPKPGSRFVLHNNGHTVQVDTEGSFYVANGGLPHVYTTVQYHFHWGHANHHGSEHKINGHAVPLEMHIVSYNSELYQSLGEAAIQPQGLAVLGIMFKVAHEDNPVLEPLIRVLHRVKNPDLKKRVEIPAIGIQRYLPADGHMFYRYNGSLTTPACFESVIWTVFARQQTISHRQLHHFRKVLQPKKQHDKHKKRSLKEEGEEAVFAELGILDNPVEKAKFETELLLNSSKDMSINEHGMEIKATLGKMSSSFTLEDEFNQKITHTSDGGHNHHGSHHNNSMPEPADDETHEYNTGGRKVAADIFVNLNKESAEIQEILVNNYRPVQPLNGRIVYRSFNYLSALDRPSTSSDYWTGRQNNQSSGAPTFFFTTKHLLCFIITFIALI